MVDQPGFFDTEARLRSHCSQKTVGAFKRCLGTATYPEGRVRLFPRMRGAANRRARQNCLDQSKDPQ